MTDVAGRTAFITGAANGIGLGIARAFSVAGARLALVDVDQEALATAAAELTRVAEVFTARLDVRDREAYARVARQAEAALGPVSILVNNAGVAAGASLDRLSYELWDWGVGINFNGVFNGIRNFVPAMIARQAGGHLINTASGAGLVPGNAGMLYHATKFGVVGMSEALQIELAPHGIGVTLLCPGPVTTGIVERSRVSQSQIDDELGATAPDGTLEKYRAAERYLQRGVAPDEVGEMVLRAARSNRLHLQTCDSFRDLLAARHQAIMDSVPARLETPRA